METNYAKLIYSREQYRGYIYANGVCLEKTPPSFLRTNALNHLNQRIRYWNRKRKLHIAELNSEAVQDE